MSKVNVNKVKAGGDVELKEKVVSINRVHLVWNVGLHVDSNMRA